MKVEYVKPFAQAAYESLNEMIDAPLKRGKLSLLKPPIHTSGVIVLIGMFGDIKGRVMLDMDIETALKIVELMNYEKFDSFNGLARDTVSELGNIIAGRAASILSCSGFKFNITPPVLLVGSKMEAFDAVQEVLLVPIEFDFGTLNVNIALKNGNP